MIEYEFQFGLGYVYAQQHVMSMPVFRNVSEENKTDKKGFLFAEWPALFCKGALINIL